MNSWICFSQSDHLIQKNCYTLNKTTFMNKWICLAEVTHFTLVN